VRQDLNELGRGAVRELRRLIEARQQEVEDIEPQTIQYQPELIVRQSSVVPSA
jgi:DNA-binding LacI/PurR family transcriptional regulator